MNRFRPMVLIPVPGLNMWFTNWWNVCSLITMMTVWCGDAVSLMHFFDDDDDEPLSRV